ncbi:MULTISPECIES: NAD-dependent epimerase/dehydratase family protein [Microbulbifer]|uniref:NAD-dependent epimerase/dehydratase family protein n=1 Tax=Microbulbifer TaxID=48073 RepID=UPI001F029F9A|nr:NAD-dependent epimerase/dehydratase family protein [Microbulbifer zhoushanensis]
MSRWVIIGGTGYIGAALCHQLAESGLPVVSVSRAPQGNPCCAGNALYTHQSISLSPGTDPGFVFQPGDRVIYAAGLADRRQCERQPGLARWLNSDCPLILLQAADARGAESFTYLSSVKAMRPPRGVLADEGAGEPAGDAYGRSKWDGERQLLNFKAGSPLNNIRSRAVYGVSDGRGTAFSSRRLTRLVPGPFGAPRALPQMRALLELDASELYSAARLRRALAWKAERRYSQYSRGNL